MSKTVNLLKAVIVALTLLPKLISDVKSVIEAVKQSKNEGDHSAKN